MLTCPKMNGDVGIRMGDRNMGETSLLEFSEMEESGKESGETECGGQSRLRNI